MDHRHRTRFTTRLSGGLGGAALDLPNASFDLMREFFELLDDNALEEMRQA